MGITTLYWPWQEAGHLETLFMCNRRTKHSPTIVFGGKANVTSGEKAQDNNEVDVYFQAFTWMDEDLNMQWLNGALIPGIGNETDEKVICVDNVGFQQAKKLHGPCRKEISALLHLLPENHTGKVQPIDASFGRMIKTKVGESMERWLQQDVNLEQWHDKISARGRRVLMTRWSTEGWKELSAFRNCLRKQGAWWQQMVLTMTKPESLEAYEF